MHMYVILRGIKDRQDRYVNDLLARYYHYDWQKGQDKGAVQLAVRPIQLYELVFPEQAYEDVYKTIWPVAWERKGWINKALAVLGKLLGTQKIPEPPKDWQPNPYFNRDGVECAGIGIKKDINHKGIEML